MVGFLWGLFFVLLLVECLIVLLLTLPLHSDTIRAFILKCLGAVWDVSMYTRTLLVTWFGFNVLLFAESLRKINFVENMDPKSMEQKMMNLNQLFRNQRNAYLTGSALFLMLVVYRLYKMQSQILVLRQGKDIAQEEGNVGKAGDTTIRQHSSKRKKAK